eukprot:10513992-Alexandrium_andersonii.AAC.1
MNRIMRGAPHSSAGGWVSCIPSTCMQQTAASLHISPGGHFGAQAPTQCPRGVFLSGHCTPHPVTVGGTVWAAMASALFAVAAAGLR